MIWLEAAPITVISRRDDGGGVIEIPISAPAPNGDFGVEELGQLVTNFAAFPVVPIGVQPHREFADRGGFSPGFIESVELRGEMLYGKVDLIPQLFHEIVELGGWRGFSIEMHLNLKTQTKEIEGWVLTGGVFTNRPAVDAHFKIAAEADATSDSTGTYTVPLTHSSRSGIGEDMAEKQAAPADGARTLAALELKTEALTTEKKTLESRVGTLSDQVRELKAETERTLQSVEKAKTDLATAEAKVNMLEAESRGRKEANVALTATVNDLTEKLDKESALNFGIRALAIRDQALADGVTPALFDDMDKDPAAWVKKSYTSLEAFERNCKVWAGNSTDLTSKVPKSAHPSTQRSAELAAETKTRLRRMGLDPKYVGIKSEGELLELNAQEKEKEN